MKLYENLLEFTEYSQKCNYWEFTLLITLLLIRVICIIECEADKQTKCKDLFVITLCNEKQFEN